MCLNACWEGKKEIRAKFFSVELSERTKSNGHKLKYKKFHLNIRKRLFHWYCTVEQILQRVCGVSILGDTQNATGNGPEWHFPAYPSFSRRVRLDNLFRCLPASAVLWLWRGLGVFRIAAKPFFVSLIINTTVRALSSADSLLLKAGECEIHGNILEMQNMYLFPSYY